MLDAVAGARRGPPDEWKSLRTNVLSVVSTDHCPFCFKEQKELGLSDFYDPNGTAVSSTAWTSSTKVSSTAGSRSRWVELGATTPARMFGLYPRKGAIAPGSDADVVVYDPNTTTTISVDTHHMNMDYSAYEGTVIRGGVDTVLSRGKVIVQRGDYLGTKGHGRYLRRGTCEYLV